MTQVFLFSSWILCVIFSSPVTCINITVSVNSTKNGLIFETFNITRYPDLFSFIIVYSIFVYILDAYVLRTVMPLKFSLTNITAPQIFSYIWLWHMSI